MLEKFIPKFIKTLTNQSYKMQKDTWNTRVEAPYASLGGLPIVNLSTFVLHSSRQNRILSIASAAVDEQWHSTGSGRQLGWCRRWQAGWSTPSRRPSSCCEDDLADACPPASPQQPLSGCCCLVSHGQTNEAFFSECHWVKFFWFLVFLAHIHLTLCRSI